MELGIQDRWLVEQFANLVLFYSSIKTRTRNTNFIQQHESVIWSVHSQHFREALVAKGFPIGKKSALICVPEPPFSEIDYLRGVLDADGSLGITGKGFPFVSLVTASSNMAAHFAAFVLEKTDCRLTPKPNGRDKIYSLTVFKEAAQTLARILYPPDCLALPRKSVKAIEMQTWQRPANMRIMHSRRWSSEEDFFILSHSVEEAATHLNRTAQSIKMRLWRHSIGKVTD